MRRVGLALSGGGFRATLYHLGVVRYLRDAGILPKISHITYPVMGYGDEMLTEDCPDRRPDRRGRRHLCSECETLRLHTCAYQFLICLQTYKPLAWGRNPAQPRGKVAIKLEKKTEAELSQSD